MRVVVVLDDTVCEDAEAVRSVKAELSRAGWRPSAGKARLEKLGMLVGEVPANQRGELLLVKGVKSVEEDAQRQVQ